MARQVHVVVGKSALDVIRAIRTAGYGATSQWLPPVELERSRAYLPGEASQGAFTDEGVPSHGKQPPVFDGETLEDAGFPFQYVIANKRADLAYFDGLGCFTADHPLELGVFSRSRHIHRKTVRSYILSRALPANALITIDRNTHIAGPELLCVQLASRLSAVELAMIVMELTGRWSLPPDTHDERAHAALDCCPVTSIERIREMSGRVPLARGRATLTRALDLACEHAASPPEAVLALMFETPIEDGGYGFGKPLLNALIRPPEEMTRYLGQVNYYTDAFLHDWFVDVEYDSNAFHFNPFASYYAQDELAAMGSERTNRLARDRRRMRDLTALGIHVVPVTAQDLASREALDRVAWAIARCAEREGGFSAASYMEKLEDLWHTSARDALFSEVTSVI